MKEEVLPPSALERLLEAVPSLTPVQMDAVAAAWHRIPRCEREAAWAVVRRFSRASACDDALDGALRARGVAVRSARTAGLHDWAFPSAAWDAGLALMTACELTQRHYRPLVAPMAQALPWLLGRPPDQPPVA